MHTIMEKAAILVESLPYLKKFAGKTFVIKYGGHAMENEELQYCFAQDVTLLKFIGINPVIVHGGGPQIGDLIKRLGGKSQFVAGMRVTDEATMEAVEMTLAGKINKSIVTLINKAGGKAIGLSGRDGNMIQAKKLLVDATDDEGNKIKADIGLVGEVTSVNTEALEAVSSHFIPVIAPVGVGDDFQPYNINADSVAGSIAAALKAEKLLLLTDVDGVKDANGSRISTIYSKDIPSLKESGVLYGGMIPKIDCAATAIEAGTTKAHIIDGRIKHSMLLEIFTDSGIGTQILYG